MGVVQRVGLRARRDRRGALRYGGAALAAAMGMREPSWIAAAQSPAGSPAPAATPTIPADFKVVLHAAEVQDWPYVLSNLKNLTQEWPRARPRVVVDGSAVTSLQGESNLTRELGTLAAAGVDLQICPHALREHDIDQASVPAYAQTTLGGVVALVLAQHKGFAYVKP